MSDPEPKALAVAGDQQPLVELGQRQLEVLHATIAPDLTVEQLELYAMTCRRLGLDPFARQIHAVVRKGKLCIQAGIDGLRLVARRTRDYRGQVGPWWCGEDGVWRDVWLESRPPAAARVGVLCEGWPEPLYAVARWRSYAVANSRTWQGMPDVMLAKCAESLALRRAFPAELSGVYEPAEMDQADGPGPIEQRPPAPRQQVPEPVRQQQAAAAYAPPQDGLAGLSMRPLSELRVALHALQPDRGWIDMPLADVAASVVARKAQQTGVVPDDRFVADLVVDARDALASRGG